MILAGRVRVNGQVPREMPVMVDPENDIITVDDEKIGAEGPGTGIDAFWHCCCRPTSRLTDATEIIPFRSRLPESDGTFRQTMKGRRCNFRSRATSQKPLVS